MTSISKIGVIVGRFQYAKLTDAHSRLISSAAERCDALVVMVGSSPMWGTDRNPLHPYLVSEEVKSHLNLNHPNRTSRVVLLSDQYCDKTWLRLLKSNLDAVVASLRYNAADPMPPTVEFFSGPDGIVPFLRDTGFFTENAVPLGDYFIDGLVIDEIEEHASSLRNQIKPEDWEPHSFKAGMIYAQRHTKPQTFFAVDAIIYDPNNDTVIVGSKSSIQPYRCLIGGMVDPSDKSIDDAVQREVKEETGLSPEYLNSFRYISNKPFKINDWRGGNVYSCAFEFIIPDAFAKARPGDDVQELIEMSAADFARGHMMLPQHMDIVNTWACKGFRYA